MNEEVIDTTATEVAQAPTPEVAPEAAQAQPEVVKQTISPEEAAAVLRAEQDKRIEACVKEINAILEKYNLGFTTAPVEIKLVSR